MIEKAFLYRFLALAFSYPSEKSLWELSEALPDLEKSLKAVGVDFPVSKLRDVLSSYLDKVETLQGEFTTLFETQLKAPARETSYELDKMGRRVIEMADIEGFYKAFGLEVKSPQEPDSLVAELEFLSFLSQKLAFLEGEGKEIVQDAYTKFLRDHLGRWYRVFADTLISTTEQEYYKTMAELLLSFLDKETEGLYVNRLTSYKKEDLEGSSWKCGFM